MPHIDEHSGNDFETVTNPDWQGLLRHTVLGIHLLIRKAILSKKNLAPQVDQHPYRQYHYEHMLMYLD